MGSETAADLLDDRRIYVALPALRLYRHSDTHDITDDQGTAYVNAPVPAQRRCLDVESYLCEQHRNEPLEIGRRTFPCLLQQLASYFAIPFFDLGTNAGGEFGGESDQSALGTDKALWFTPRFPPTDIRADQGAQGSSRRLAARAYETRRKSALGNLVVTHWCACPGFT